MKTFLKRLLQLYRPFTKSLGIALLWALAIQGVQLIAPFFAGQMTRHLVAQSSWSTIQWLVVLSFISYFARNIFGYFKDKYEIRELDFSLRKYASEEMLKKIHSLSIGQHRQQNSGLTQSVINKGEHSLSEFAFVTLYNLLPVSLEIVLSIAAMLWVDLATGSIMLFGMIAFIIVGVLQNLKFRDDITKLDRMGNKNSKFHSEILRNLPLIISNSQESRIEREYAQVLECYTVNSVTLWEKWTLWSVLSHIGINVVRACIIYMSARAVFIGRYQIDTFVMVITWANMALADAWQIKYLQRQITEMVVKLENYIAIRYIEPAVKNADDATFPNIKGAIEFQDVSFVYPDEKYVTDDDEEPDEKNSPSDITKKKHALRNVTFSIRPGERIAFVGESGSGKSTIISLLIRAYEPTSGEIRIDGERLLRIDYRYFRSQIGLVEQNVRLLDNTMRYNILFGLNGHAEDVAPEELDRIARLAGIHHFYDRLTDGFNTKIGENGVELSGGERQRVGIARALIKNPKILILDEATSSLDAKNERLIKKAVDLISVGRTTIIIAHRLSTVRNADRIFVLDKGHIVGVGKHEELLETCPTYAELVQEQMFPI